jgi:acyl-CoA synthetase (AMP-forming)/AMP-acid ligase II
LTFSELDRWSDTCAAAFAAAGVGPGRAVLVFSLNRLEVMVACAAAWKIGAVAVPVVAIYRRHELRHILADSTPAVIVTSEAIGDRSVREEIDEVLADIGHEPAARYLMDAASTVSEGWSAFPPRPEKVPDRILVETARDGSRECLRLYTSGTTAAPKGARLSSSAVVFASCAYRDILGLTEADVSIALAPVAHIGGLYSACLVPLVSGGASVVLPRWTRDAGFEAILRHGVTWSTGAAVFLSDIVGEYERRDDPSLHVMRTFTSGGARTPPELVRRADRLGIRAMRVFGMTETAGPITMGHLDSSLERRAEWDGCLVPGNQARIVDDLGDVVPPGTEGNLQITGAQVMLGYTDEALTAAQMRHGWFDPGDRAVLSEDGWLRFAGRTKDIINRGGEKFSASDIELAIVSHPAVEAAAVIGVPDERLGEVVAAHVVLRNGGVASPVELIDHLLAYGLAKAKLPVEWNFPDALPRTASGKVQKHLLGGRSIGA